jgi:hypothetical protein
MLFMLKLLGDNVRDNFGEITGIGTYLFDSFV